MKTLFRAVSITAALLVVVAVSALLTMPGPFFKLREVDAVSVDQFLVNKRALYDALNARMMAPPAGAVLPQPYDTAWKPKLQLWPTDDYVRFSAGSGYTYETDTRFVLDLEHSTLPLDPKMWDNTAAHALADYYREPLADQGFQVNGHGGTSGKSQFVSEHWERPSDPTLTVDIQVFVAPLSKEAIVTFEVHERLSK